MFPTSMLVGAPASSSSGSWPCGVSWLIRPGSTCASIEAASPFGWLRWVGDEGAMLAMDGFGASAPGERLFQEFKFTPERAAEIVRQLLARRYAPGKTEGS